MALQLELQQVFEPDLIESQIAKVSWRLIAANRILQQSSLELEQTIALELEANPALELVDVERCRACGSEMLGSICPRCIQGQKEAVGDRGAEDGYAHDEPGERTRLLEDDDFDRFSRVRSQATLAQRLLLEIGAEVPALDMPIAEYLVGSLDDKGYLRIKSSDVAYELDVSEERVNTVLAVLQAQEPAGIGTRNLRECLLVQIERLAERGHGQPFASEIVSMYLTELGEHKFARIARELKIREKVVADAWAFIKKLNPHPAQGFASINDSDQDTRASYLIPDVVVSNTPEHEFQVDVVASTRRGVRINPMYAQLSAELRQDGTGLTDAERLHVHAFIMRARLFVSNLAQRERTLHQITAAILEVQRDFVVRGVRYLKPLTRGDIARRIGVNDSTVSRATAGKYVMLPSGQVLRFAHFFTPSLRAKDVLKTVLEGEGKALTDMQIRVRLQDSGIHIARRTVAKYRRALAILPSPLR